MKISRQTVNGSPFVGVFCRATDKFVLLPRQVERKEADKIAELFGIEAIQCNVANSSLIGALSIANSRGIVLPKIAEASELDAFKSAGIKAKIVENMNALGNLVALNDGAGICSPALDEKAKKEIEGFLKVEIQKSLIGGSDLVGSSIVVSNKGFIVRNAVAKKDFLFVKKVFGLKGMATTANFGDGFVANSVIANSNAAIVGMHTSSHEILRIDEGLSGNGE